MWNLVEHRYWPVIYILFNVTGHVETAIVLYRKDYKVGEKGKKVTDEVGMIK